MLRSEERNRQKHAEQENAGQEQYRRVPAPCDHWRLNPYYEARDGIGKVDVQKVVILLNNRVELRTENLDEFSVACWELLEFDVSGLGQPGELSFELTPLGLKDLSLALKAENPLNDRPDVVALDQSIESACIYQGKPLSVAELSGQKRAGSAQEVFRRPAWER